MNRSTVGLLKPLNDEHMPLFAAAKTKGAGDDLAMLSKSVFNAGSTDPDEDLDTTLVGTERAQGIWVQFDGIRSVPSRVFIPKMNEC
ncbi:hypothetical protein SH501x_000939 [Pirellulaceae bacterium SH501]